MKTRFRLVLFAQIAVTLIPVFEAGAQGICAEPAESLPSSAVDKSEPADRYAGAKVLDERITGDPNDPALLSRIRLVRTDDAKYPLVRVEDKLAVDPGTGERKIVQQRAMIADHIVVKLKPGASEADLVPLMQPLGAKIREQFPESELYLIAFPHPGIDTVPHAVGHFVSTQIEYAGPDDLSSIQEPAEK